MGVSVEHADIKSEGLKNGPQAAAGAATCADGSVDPGEIARFEALAAQWWSPNGPMRPLHKMNPVRVQWICEQISIHFRDSAGERRDIRSSEGLAGLTILDIGCGGGILSESLAKRGAAVTGLEPAAQNLAIARSHAQEHGLTIDYRGETAEAMAAAGHSYDIVCALEVVEHVVDMEAFTATACALVKPGGLFFVSTLNRTLKSFALAIIGAEYVLRWVPAGTHQWEKFVKPEELRAVIADAGLRMAAETGMIYNPISSAWKTGRDKDVNYMLAARRPRRNRSGDS